MVTTTITATLETATAVTTTAPASATTGATTAAAALAPIAAAANGDGGGGDGGDDALVAGLTIGTIVVLVLVAAGLLGWHHHSQTRRSLEERVCELTSQDARLGALAEETEEARDPGFVVGLPTLPGYMIHEPGTRAWPSTVSTSSAHHTRLSVV